MAARRLMDRIPKNTPSLNDGKGIAMKEEMADMEGQPRRPVEEEPSVTEEPRKAEVNVVCVEGNGQQGSLMADVAGVTFWKRILGTEMLRAISGCHQHHHLHQPDLEMNPQWFVVGNASFRSYERHTLCVFEPRAVVVQLPGTYARHATVCQAMGGALVSDTDPTSATLTALYGLNDTCVDAGGLITWLKGGHRVSEAEVKMHSEECPAMSVEGRRWASCELQLECCVCEASASVLYTLYGHDGSLFDHSYFIPTHTTTLMFTGLGGSEILRKNNGWVLRSTQHNTQWLLGKFEVPIGRHNWSTGEQEVVLALSMCRTTQFACDDGQCIPQTSRCDDIVHCSDSSDEADCKVVEQPQGYHADYPPPPRPGEVLPVVLGYHIDVYDVGDVTTEEGEASMDLGITVSWFDPRLKYLNLKTKIKNYFPCELVWTPRVRPVSGRRHGTILTSNNYEKFCYAYSNDQTELRPLHDPLMSHWTDGATTAIELYLGILIKVPCHFHLQMYPFDVQLCNLSFVVVNDPWRSLLRKSSPGRHVPYLNARRVLLEYSLEALTTEAGWSLQGADNNTNCVLTFHLRRLHGYHLTNSFFPSILIFFISYATFFFQVEDFTNRIMIALTAQLVLAELFSSTTSSSVKTPYLKLIDVWYAAIITFCFLIVISQIVTNVVLHRVRLPGIIVRVRELDWPQQAKVSPLFVRRVGVRHRRKQKRNAMRQQVPSSSREMALLSNSVARVSLLAMAALFVVFYVLMAAGLLRVVGSGTHPSHEEQAFLQHYEVPSVLPL
nr:uncharacterized protein LOC123770379 [Procambarus clarkii]